MIDISPQKEYKYCDDIDVLLFINKRLCSIVAILNAESFETEKSLV
jgi:hypothetical protein